MAKVLAIDQTRFDEPQPVYNFTVKGPHTYFVLDAGVLVHNASCLDDVRGVFDQFEHKGIYSIDLRVIGQHGELRRQVKELVSDYPGETNYIYALVDAEVGDVLKVGKTTNPLGRFPNYGTTQRNFLTAHECHGTEYFTHLELHIMIGPPIPERKTLNSVEGA